MPIRELMHNVDRAAIFANILTRQQLRREAKLPLLDVRATFEREVRQALWVEHVLHQQDHIQAEVLRIEREKRGPTFPESGGGWWIVAAKVRATLTASFRAQRRADLRAKRS